MMRPSDREVAGQRIARAAPGHLRRRDRLGTLAHRERTTTGPARRSRHRTRRHPRRGRSPTARKVGDCERAVRHETLAASYLAVRDHYQQREQTLGQAMADRRKWERATAEGRHLAIAADTELRRRYPEQKIGPLCSAEPVFISATEREHLDPGSDWRFMELASWMRESAAQLQAFRADTLSPLWKPHRDAILQPPKPQITPSAKILQLSGEHVVEPEAAG